MHSPHSLRLAISISGALLTTALAAQTPAARDAVWTIGDTAAQVRITGGHAAVSRDGGTTWTPLARPDTRLHLRIADFDPLAGEPVVPPGFADDGRSRLFVVQLTTPIIAEHREALGRLGAEVHGYLPSQSYLVRMDRAVAPEVQNAPWVRWVGSYHPAYRLDAPVLADLAGGTIDGAARYHVLAVDHVRDEAALETAIAGIGGLVDMRAQGGGLVTATLTGAQLAALSRHDTVQWIDRWAPFEVDMNNARAQSGAATLHDPAIDVDGKGIRAHSFDTGFQTSHPELAARPPYRQAPIVVLGVDGGSHGASVTGILGAQGLNAQATGMMPFAQILVTGFGSGISNRYNLARVLRDPAGSFRALTTTSSVSQSRSLTYTSVSAATDRWIFDFEFYYTQSQSNAGGRNSRPEAWAKNGASVAGFDHFNNTNPADDRVASGTSRGPAADGRIGVTFAGYYDSIFTITSGSGYTNFCCTSGATPMVSGLSGLIIQLFTDGHYGYPGAGWQNRFDVQPHFTTVKALVMATTRPVAFNRANRFEQGWGFPNVEEAYELRDKILVVDEEDVLAQGGSRTYWVFAPGGEQLRACMTYADLPANPSASIHRVNSLDLRVRAPDGTAYWGNQGLLTGPFSAAGGAANDRDTEEAVWLRSAPRGIYTVTVSAPAVRQDGHPETAAVDADFALAVRGIGGGRDTSGMVMDLVSDAPGQFSVSLTNAPAAGWTVGYTVLSLDTARHLSLGNFLGVELDAVSFAVLTQPPGAGNVFAFTNAGAGVYPSVPFDFPAPVATALQGLTFDATAFLLDSQGGVVATSNVDRVTVQ